MGVLLTWRTTIVFKKTFSLLRPICQIEHFIQSFFRINISHLESSGTVYCSPTAQTQYNRLKKGIWSKTNVMSFPPKMIKVINTIIYRKEQYFQTRILLLKKHRCNCYCNTILYFWYVDTTSLVFLIGTWYVLEFIFLFSLAVAWCSLAVHVGSAAQSPHRVEQSVCHRFTCWRTRGAVHVSLCSRIVDSMYPKKHSVFF